jgi:hypothetical protein
MEPARHCRHCLGDGCDGQCLIGGGQCIHGWNERPPRQFRLQLLTTRRFWQRVLWGEYPRGRYESVRRQKFH